MERWAYRYPEFLLSASTAGTPDFEEMSSERGSLWSYIPWHTCALSVAVFNKNGV